MTFRGRPRGIGHMHRAHKGWGNGPHISANAAPPLVFNVPPAAHAHLLRPSGRLWMAAVQSALDVEGTWREM